MLFTVVVVAVAYIPHSLAKLTDRTNTHTFFTQFAQMQEKYAYTHKHNDFVFLRGHTMWMRARVSVVLFLFLYGLAFLFCFC